MNTSIYQRIQSINSRIKEIKSMHTKNMDRFGIFSLKKSNRYKLNISKRPPNDGINNTSSLEKNNFNNILKSKSNKSLNKYNNLDFLSKKINNNLSNKLAGSLNKKKLDNSLSILNISDSLLNSYGKKIKIKMAMKQASNKYKIPFNLIKSMVKVESNFNINALSRAGAQGLMQLMPKTANELGVTNSFDILQNINGGSKYIKTLLGKFGGNLPFALAAYNSGISRVKKANDIPNFSETKNYVSKVLSNYKLYNKISK